MVACYWFCLLRVMFANTVITLGYISGGFVCLCYLMVDLLVVGCLWSWLWMVNSVAV